MFKKLKKLLMLVLVLTLCFNFTACDSEEKIEEEKTGLKIVTTNFPCYDFARAVVKDNENVSLTMLLKPGVESHNYDPTPQDILEIQNADLFIYVGGESDEWVDKILDSIDTTSLSVFKMSDYVTMQVEEFKEGMTGKEEEDDEEEIEYDEHVWTSPKNAIILVQKIRDAIIKLDIENKDIYNASSEEYIDLLKSLDEEFTQVVKENYHRVLVFGDRFPLIYFTKEYGLDYYAAFPGCSSESEVSAKTLVYLINKIKEENIEYVFHIELSSTKVCETLQEETGCEILLFHSAHNVTKEEFENGETYYSLMHGNVERLRLAIS